MDVWYYGFQDIVIPIQVKMHQGSVGRVELDKLMGVQASLNNQGSYAPMSILVTLYGPSIRLKEHAFRQGMVSLRNAQGNQQLYPRVQAVSVEEILTKNAKVQLPPVDQAKTQTQRNHRF